MRGLMNTTAGVNVKWQIFGAISYSQYVPCTILAAVNNAKLLFPIMTVLVEALA